MNVLLVLTTAVTMQHAQTLMRVIHVFVSLDMMEMDLTAPVCKTAGCNTDTCTCTAILIHVQVLNYYIHVHTCVLLFYADINECSSSTHNCSMNAICMDTDGSYYCTCNSGYIGDGFNCTSMSTVTHTPSSVCTLFSLHLFFIGICIYTSTPFQTNSN